MVILPLGWKPSEREREREWVRGVKKQERGQGNQEKEEEERGLGLSEQDDQTQKVSNFTQILGSESLRVALLTYRVWSSFDIFLMLLSMLSIFEWWCMCCWE